MFMYFLFVLPAVLLAMWAQWRVQSAYREYSQMPNAQRLTGLDVAHVLMRNEGLEHVRVEHIGGDLTDHYDPREKVMRLSEGSSRVPSVAAMAIVAHELGHAVQDQQDYAWLRVRSGIVGFANIGSQLGTILVFVGLLLTMFNRAGVLLAVIGVALFSVAVAFTLITLPVEFNASARARSMLMRNGLVTTQETAGVDKVLNAAAMTYVAAAASAVSQLLYFIFLLAGRRN
ncbi:MAG: zinc metallopeptidase [Chloroflexales bacterium]|nr:zinc metallopeptidase [Chloroflexales bacterium]